MTCPPTPRVRPMLLDPIESERCPDCGTPGVRLGGTWGPFEEWACPDCDPGEVEEVLADGLGQI